MPSAPRSFFVALGSGDRARRLASDGFTRLSSRYDDASSVSATARFSRRVRYAAGWTGSASGATWWPSSQGRFFGGASPSFSRSVGGFAGAVAPRRARRFSVATKSSSDELDDDSGRPSRRRRDRSSCA